MVLEVSFVWSAKASEIIDLIFFSDGESPDLSFALALPFATILGGVLFQKFRPLFRRQCHELIALVVVEFNSSGADSAV